MYSDWRDLLFHYSWRFQRFLNYSDIVIVINKEPFISEVFVVFYCDSVQVVTLFLFCSFICFFSFHSDYLLFFFLEFILWLEYFFLVYFLLVSAIFTVKSGFIGHLCFSLSDMIGPNNVEDKKQFDGFHSFSDETSQCYEITEVMFINSTLL